MNMIIPEFNQVSYGKNSLRVCGPKLWNSLPYRTRSFENPETSKKQLTIGMGNTAFVMFVIIVNKLKFNFKVDLLFLLRCSHKFFYFALFCNLV